MRGLRALCVVRVSPPVFSIPSGLLVCLWWLCLEMHYILGSVGKKVALYQQLILCLYVMSFWFIVDVWWMCLLKLITMEYCFCLDLFTVNDKSLDKNIISLNMNY